jgi:hypothetical protein
MSKVREHYHGWLIMCGGWITANSKGEWDETSCYPKFKKDMEERMKNEPLFIEGLDYIYSFCWADYYRRKKTCRD